jgi:hypothetical protein
VHVDVRPTNRLRGSRSIDVAGCLGPVIQALAEDSVDLSRVRVVCDWIQYRSNFRDIVDVRSILSAPSPVAEPSAFGVEEGLEIAIDLRRADEVDLRALAAQLLVAHRSPQDSTRVYLEGWTPEASSIIWQFNALYWRALSAWEEVTGSEYEQALPGGESDARNKAAARELILDLFKVWDDLAQRNALPEELYVVELGVGNGNQARAWLDEFAALDQVGGRDYYRRLHYLMGDYSPHVLERAQHAVAGHRTHVSALVLDATELARTLGFLRYKAFLFYMSNVYDNLPGDEVARIRGRVYLVHVRAYLPDVAAAAIAEQVSAPTDAVPALVSKLLRLGPELLTESLPRHFPKVEDAVEFWRQCWQHIRLEERYVPLAGLDSYEIAPGLTGENLRPLLEAGGDLRMQVSNGTVASLVDTLPLLHPFGRLLCHDLFLTDIGEYETSFRGPGKYDGSVVNWVNGPLLAQIGGRRGFDVDFKPFRHRAGSNVKTLTVHTRD